MFQEKENIGDGEDKNMRKAGGQDVVNFQNGTLNE